MKLLSSILEDLKRRGVPVDFDSNGGSRADQIEVESLTDDSRYITEKTIFALHSVSKPYLQFAKEKSAALWIATKADSVEVPHGIGILTGKEKGLFSHPSFLLGNLSASFYNWPSEKLEVVGITGTNGKTTVASMLFFLWKDASIPCARIGTLGVEVFDGKSINSFETGYTTPRSYQLHRILNDLAERKIEKVALEVSSEAIALGRHYGLKFTAAGFTGLGIDHLDAHRNLFAYFSAKRKLFSLTYKQDGIIVIPELKDQTVYRGIVASIRLITSIRKLELKKKSESNLFILKEPFDGWLPAPTNFNRWNAAIALKLSGLSASQDRFKDFPGVSGRVELIRPESETYRNSITGIVDYAHSPDSLEKLLSECRAMNPGFLICVFGCGGDRDRSKRPLMGRISSHHADTTILTDDNPRTEDPDAIRTEIYSGTDKNRNVIEIAGRKEAIFKSVEIAKKQTEHFNHVTVVVAGKGHETYQIYGKQKNHFSDMETLKLAFESL